MASKEAAGAFLRFSHIYYQEGQMSGGGDMKEKIGHLVVWVEIGVLAILLVRFCAVRIGENAERIRGFIVQKQENTENSSEKIEKETASDKVVGDSDGRDDRAEDMQEDTPEGNFQEKKKVALTFDDGPSSKYTPLLWEGLKERGVHATFFLMGKNIEGKEALVKQMQEEGHLIGNHTYNHVQLDKISKEAAKEEIKATNQEIYQITGVYPAWLRPPYGEWRKNLDFYVEMLPVLWDVDTLDWKSKNVDSIMRIVKNEVEDGSVILMHDAYQSSVDAALQIVDLLTAEGYEFVTVEELILP